MHDYTIEEASEILAKAAVIQKDPVLVKAAQEHLKKKAQSIGSIADLRKMNREGLTKKDLMTEEDKQALQIKIELDEKSEKAGFPVKDKVKLADEEEDDA